MDREDVKRISRSRWLRPRFLFGLATVGIIGFGVQALDISISSWLSDKKELIKVRRSKEEQRQDRKMIDSNFFQYIPKYEIPTREQQIEKLKEKNKVFDIFVIGGGATGAGVAMDAASRGLSVAMVERDDFSSGASSKSTKLIHGGVRYLEKAVFNLDIVQFKLVLESLQERALFLSIAPHLTSQLPFMLPIYKKWQVPYFWSGCKLYDILAGSKGLNSSFFLRKQQALERFPMLKKDGLVGAMVYYDGQQDDSRMNVALALTAAWKGAVVTNHTEVVQLLKDNNGEVCGATVRDNITNEQWDVKAKTVISATGPFTDEIRRMDEPNAPSVIVPSSGVHIVLPDYYSPTGMGMLDPATSDGRVLFMLPWMGRVIAGTTDSPTTITSDPIPSEDDICFILEEIKNYLSSAVNVRRGDVLAAWSGIRPLVTDPSASSTQAIARTHVISVNPKSKLIFVAGGKWTIYRAMARDTVDKAIEIGQLSPSSSSKTDEIKIIGSYQWSPTMFIRLIQDYGFDKEVAVHLSNTYGDRAFEFANDAILTGKRWPVVGKRLCSEFPYIEDEVRFAVKEYARTATDVIARRLRLSFLSVSATEEVLPRIINIMAEELQWKEDRKKKEYADAIRFLETMGKKPNILHSHIALNENERLAYSKEFEKIDFDHDGHISVTDLKRVIGNLGISMTDLELSALINEVDTDQSGGIGLNEFLTLMSSISTGDRIPNRLSTIAKCMRKKIAVERSSGDL